MNSISYMVGMRSRSFFLTLIEIQQIPNEVWLEVAVFIKNYKKL